MRFASTAARQKPQHLSLLLERIYDSGTSQLNGEGKQVAGICERLRWYRWLFIVGREYLQYFPLLPSLSFSLSPNFLLLFTFLPFGNLFSFDKIV